MNKVISSSAGNSDDYINNRNIQLNIIIMNISVYPEIIIILMSPSLKHIIGKIQTYI